MRQGNSRPCDLCRTVTPSHPSFCPRGLESAFPKTTLSSHRLKRRIEGEQEVGERNCRQSDRTPRRNPVDPQRRHKEERHDGPCADPEQRRVSRPGKCRNRGNHKGKHQTQYSAKKLQRRISELR